MHILLRLGELLRLAILAFCASNPCILFERLVAAAHSGSTCPERRPERLFQLPPILLHLIKFKIFASWAPQLQSRWFRGARLSSGVC